MITRQNAPYLPREECKHRHLYRLASRNLPIGVWNETTRGFTGIRLKFGTRFLSEEYHWDEPEFATAKPLELLEVVPDNIAIPPDTNEGRHSLFTWLTEAENKYCPYLVRTDRWTR